MENNIAPENTSPLLVQYKSTLPSAAYDHSLTFEEIYLEPKKFGVDDLIDIVISRSIDDIIITGNFKSLIDKGTTDYRNFQNAIKNETDKLPILIDNYVQKKGEVFKELVRNLISYLKWQKNMSCLGRTRYIPADAHWTFEGVSNTLKISTRTLFDLKWDFDSDHTLTVDDFQNLKTFLAVTRKAPHHELLSDAEELYITASYRGAYLMLYSALEVATKNLLYHRLPEAEWLIFTLQSPPLSNIYTQFISKAENYSIIVDPKEINTLKAMANKRNDIAHQGITIESSLVYEHLQLVKKWINIIDSQIGFVN